MKTSGRFKEQKRDGTTAKVRPMGRPYEADEAKLMYDAIAAVLRESQYDPWHCPRECHAAPTERVPRAR